MSIDTRDGRTHIDLDGGGFLGICSVVLLMLGPATFLAAIAPARGRAPAEPAPPGP